MNDNHLRNKLSYLVRTIFDLSKCTSKNCNKLDKLIEKDAELMKMKKQMMMQKNDKKREIIINKLSKNKKLIDYQTCIYKNCYELMKKNLNAFIDIILEYVKIKKLHLDNNLKLLMKTTKKLLKKSSLNQNELRELSHSSLSFITYIKHHHRS
jgi:hypothetical protein